MRSDDSLARILLVSRLFDEGVQPLKPSEYWKLCSQIGKPSVLLGQTESELSQGHGFESEFAARIVRLLARATDMTSELERLEQSGISTLTPFDDRYPERFIKQLATRAPTLLYAAGELHLLQRPGIGVVGSRDVSDDGADVAKEAAQLAAGLGYGLVSGGARGVDELAMYAALDAGGTVVGVLAGALERKLKSPDVRGAIHERRAVMCTPYNPDAPHFHRGTAMGRNKLIYALSIITLVVASDLEKGGTWYGASKALEQRSGRVGVWRGPGQGPGNEKLIEKGALAISSIDDLEAAVTDPEAEAVQPTQATQQSLLGPGIQT
ncbi:DNA-processing protein DprA [Candidatus Poriferisocius sp.]|uniref:DNA-processing protein DprA n=1 Tax=Candidatus Poriferisocius sp. TaxID=3101276 RepID=UPI003B02539B